MTATLTPATAGGPGPAAATPRPALDAAIAELGRRRDAWLALSHEDRRALLADLRRRFLTVAPRWVEATRTLEGIAATGPFVGEEWLAGPYPVLRNIRLLERTFADLAAGRVPEPPGPVTTRQGGRVVVRVFPTGVWDRAFFPGVTADVWMDPGVRLETLSETQAVAYREGAGRGAVALVLGAGNVSSIGPMDTLHKLFTDRQVVLYKSHPVQDPVAPLYEEAFAAFIEAGWLRVVRGGAEVGAYLTDHPGIDEIHVTGSDRTYEAIVFGTGEEGAARKAAGRRRLTKRVTAELGNVSPVIVVPGPWSAGDVAYQGENIASMLTNNAGFNCNAARIVVTHAEWARREDLLAAVRVVLAATPIRPAYYPGAAERCDRVVAVHPEAELYGQRHEGELPWVFVPGLDPAAHDDPAFRVEAFCSLFGEAPIPAPSVARFVERAVEFCNRTLWGTLNVTLLVHPASLRDAETATAVERAVADLEYGTVSLNHWAAVGYAIASTPWGSYPGNEPTDIQSGVGWVHNPFLFDRPEKAVIRSPFRAWPKPPWFVSHKTAGSLAEDLTSFEAERSLASVPSILWHALRG